MKQVKVNLMVIAAITIAVMTMSFKQLGKNSTNANLWYEIELDGENFSQNPPGNQKPDDCSADNGPTCALKITFHEAVAPPLSVTEAEEMVGDGLISIDERAYREN